MNKVQEALKASIDEINDLVTHIRDREPTTLFSSAELVINQCKAVLADIEKCEPVVWYDEKLGVFDEKHFDQLVPLYTSPISKEWVVIDEETIDDIGNTLSDEQGFIPVETWTEFARAIEAKLKQLNTKG